VNQVEPTDCQACDWISIEDVLQQQDIASAPAPLANAAPSHVPSDSAAQANTRSFGQRLSGLFKARAADT